MSGPEVYGDGRRDERYLAAQLIACKPLRQRPSNKSDINRLPSCAIADTQGIMTRAAHQAHREMTNPTPRTRRPSRVMVTLCARDRCLPGSVRASSPRGES